MVGSSLNTAQIDSVRIQSDRQPTWLVKARGTSPASAGIPRRELP